MPAVWPPAPRATDVLVKRRTGTQVGAPWVELRQVRLWNQAVLIDEAGAVWCQGCLATFSLQALCAWDSGHTVRPPWRSDVSASTGPLTRTPRPPEGWNEPREPEAW